MSSSTIGPLSPSDYVPLWLRRRLRELDWTPAELARRAGMSPARVRRVINRRQSPGLDFFQGVARAFDMPLESVLRGVGVLPAVEDANGENELLSYFRMLPPYDRRRLLATACKLWTADQQLHAG